MAFALGSALMARDIAGERKELEDEERRLQRASEDAVKAQQKSGMWGSIGKTLGSIGAGTIGGILGGPAGAIMAGKMAGSYLGGKVGQGLVSTKEEEKACESFFESLKLLTEVNFIVFNINDSRTVINYEAEDEIGSYGGTD